MRLTLRTLLAYLDNTLDPQDVVLLRQKLEESSFATQLVQGIRSALSSKISAPSPLAVGPIDEANVISEYLDSTMPAEQVAEIERACLESGVLLAEVAACHQILTMVLGQKADVPQELRQRIYDLPDKSIEQIAAGAGSFSSVAIPEEPASLGPIQDGVPTVDGLEPPRPSEPVQPVGKDDTGVSDAPTRLRQTGQAADATENRSQRAREAATLYGGSIRTSRIAPWLVSLGLAAVLLFALTKVFAPLLNPTTTASNQQNEATETEQEDAVQEDGDIEIDEDSVAPPIPGMGEPVEQAPGKQPGGVDAANNTDDKVGSNVSEESDSIVGTPDAANAPADANAPDAAPDVPPGEVGSPVGVPSESIDIGELGIGLTDTAEPAGGPDAPDSVPDAAPVPPGEVASNDPMPEQPGPDDPRVPDAPLVPDAAPAPDVPPNNDAPEADVPAIAKLVTAKTLVCASRGDHWLRLGADAAVGHGVTILCAPRFRGELETVNGLHVTLVGPTQLRFGQQGDATVLEIDHGNVLLSTSEPDVTLSVTLGGKPATLRLKDVDAKVAMSTRHVRAPGYDPLVDENRKQMTGLLAVNGTIAVSIDETEVELTTGNQWVKKGDLAGAVSGVEIVPSWIDPIDPNERTLESAAVDGLISLLGDQPVEMSLREATSFRRGEVAALAAQTLLYMGESDVYFGGDGVLSNPKQLLYWPEHFKALLANVDESKDRATMVSVSVANMDAANAKSIRRLLTGYSQKQLVEGGDEELVRLLDSPSMAVRVLALENLQQITGKTLYFRAEQENAIRRAPIIDKWEVLLRKGLIRRQG